MGAATTTPAELAGVPAVSWDATDDEWLTARRQGLGGSDVSAVLGFSSWTTPWEVWADKTGTRHPESGTSIAAELGLALEPWLRTQATRILGTPVALPPARTYRHPTHGWRMCSPDGVTGNGRIVELKTAGLVSGYGTPPGWADEAVPLGYEFQVRWSMHVMDAPAAEVIALVAGVGLVHRTIVRDWPIEADLIAQLDQWWQEHIVAGVEPVMGANPDLLGHRYPIPNGNTVDLDGTDALEHWIGYRAARDAETAAAAEKERHACALKALLGDNETGLLDGHRIAVWGPKKGPVDWPRVVADLTQRAGMEPPDLDAYRKPPTRCLTVKD